MARNFLTVFLECGSEGSIHTSWGSTVLLFPLSDGNSYILQLYYFLIILIKGGKAPWGQGLSRRPHGACSSLGTCRLAVAGWGELEPLGAGARQGWCGWVLGAPLAGEKELTYWSGGGGEGSEDNWLSQGRSRCAAPPSPSLSWCPPLSLSLFFSPLPGLSILSPPPPFSSCLPTLPMPALTFQPDICLLLTTALALP